MHSRKPLQYRPNVGVNESLMQRIGHRLCWHFDAFVRRTGRDDFYLIIEQRWGGRARVHNSIEPLYYRLRHDGALLPARVADLIGGEYVTFDILPRVWREAILKAHHDYIIPWAYEVPTVARNVSRRLHYWPVHDIPAIAEFTFNHCTRDGGRLYGPITYEYEYHSDTMPEQNAKTTYSDETPCLGVLGTKNDNSAV